MVTVYSPILLVDRREYVVPFELGLDMLRVPNPLDRAKAAIVALREKGVEAVIAGSWARGQQNDNSDIDFLVISCPRPLKYKIESLVEDTLHSSHFDLIYREDARPSVLATLESQTLSLEQLMTR